MRDFLLIIFQDLKIIFRQAFNWIIPLVFFIMVISLFALTLSNHPDVLDKIAPVLIWMSALLATIISTGQLFKLEKEEGSLDLLLLDAHSLTAIAACKTFAHWLAYSLPLILISPLLGILLHLAPQTIGVLSLTLLLGTPVLTMIGAIGSALTVGVRSGGILLPILIMPLYIPVLIFGIGTVMAFQHQVAIVGYLAILGAIFLLTCVFAPFFTSVALKIGVNQ